ncbi:MAG: ABC transporter permease [Actinobacteria bacterium]|nr:ABC transporter permease [Actinomycetota bacterium]
MRAVLAIATMNLRRLLRERSSLFFVFIFPLALILLIGATFGGGVERSLTVASGGTALGEELTAALADVEGVEVERVDTAGEVADAVALGRATAGVVVDAEAGQVRFLTRPSSTGPALRSAVDAAVARVSTRAAAMSLVGPGRTGLVDDVLAAVPAVAVTDARIGGDPSGLDDLGRFDLGAAQQLFLFVFVTSLSGSAALILSRQLGLTRRMLAAPVTTAQVLAGEALGRFAIALVQGLYIIVGTALLFDVAWGDPLVIGVVLIVFCAISAGAAMLVGASLRNDQQASGIGVMAGLGIAALGGSMISLDFMTIGMRRVAHVTPHAWALDAVAESVRFGGGLGDVVVEIAVLLAFAVVLLTAATWALHRATVRTAS